MTTGIQTGCFGPAVPVQKRTPDTWFSSSVQVGLLRAATSSFIVATTKSQPIIVIAGHQQVDRWSPSTTPLSSFGKCWSHQLSLIAVCCLLLTSETKNLTIFANFQLIRTPKNSASLDRPLLSESIDESNRRPHLVSAAKATNWVWLLFVVCCWLPKRKISPFLRIFRSFALPKIQLHWVGRCCQNRLTTRIAALFW
jgi:hypothetical protein